MGVPASPGSSEIAADDAVEAPMRLMTVSFFWSSTETVLAKVSGFEKNDPTTKNESSPTAMAATMPAMRRRLAVWGFMGSLWAGPSRYA